ncbi:frataxin homolog, mitochondrial [Leptidea sinapis]|uniref:frataxin homolog, mitochondrial n=1 Tax=Leptidea sinapis TaxID=189913 RepID=UPI00213D4942|nr:frataxin homolog, mitochondrial [Leptidea sinapis]
MLKSAVRTSYWLVRRTINKTPAVIPSSQPKSFRTEIVLNCKLYSSDVNISNNIEQAVFEDICNETLESLCEYFEEVIDQSSSLKGADVTFSDGVLTIFLGPEHGTYVINRQTPNKQIWLSSPVSGPKRYDLALENGGYWVYKHDGVTLHKLLQSEISKIIEKADFSNCAHFK